jgi:hypothetical protein
MAREGIARKHQILINWMVLFLSQAAHDLISHNSSKGKHTIAWSKCSSKGWVSSQKDQKKWSWIDRELNE